MRLKEIVTCIYMKLLEHSQVDLTAKLKSSSLTLGLT